VKTWYQVQGETVINVDILKAAIASGHLKSCPEVNKRDIMLWTNTSKKQGMAPPLWWTCSSCDSEANEKVLLKSHQDLTPGVNICHVSKI
jgi:hypothetical protein